MFQVRLGVSSALAILRTDNVGELLKLIVDYSKGKFLQFEFGGPYNDEDDGLYHCLILGVMDLEDLLPLSQHLGVDAPVWANVMDGEEVGARTLLATCADSKLRYQTFGEVRAEMEK